MELLVIHAQETEEYMHVDATAMLSASETNALSTQ
jgi:hypothetical protein